MPRPRKSPVSEVLTPQERFRAKKALAAKAREALKQKLLRAGDKAVPKGRVSPLTSAPLDAADFRKSLEGQGFHVQANLNEAAMMNRTFLSVDGMLDAIAQASVALTERASEVIASAALQPLEITMMAESLSRAANSCAQAMSTLMDMHRVHLRDPIRVIEKGDEVDKPPSGDKAREFLAKLVRLPPPKSRVHAAPDPVERPDVGTTPKGAKGAKTR